MTSTRYLIVSSAVLDGAIVSCESDLWSYELSKWEQPKRYGNKRSEELCSRIWKFQVD